MGDFIYNGAHSINFSGVNTWERWHIAPKARPYVADPSVKTEYVDVPGSSVTLDYTEALTGAVCYGQRTGSWEFIADLGYMDPFKLQSDILGYLHGKKHEVVLADEPEYKYTGRISVRSNLSNSDYPSFTISYNLDPFKDPVDSVNIGSWKWNELFNNTIVLGPFTVRGGRFVTLVNPNDEAKDSTINVTSSADFINIENLPGSSLDEKIFKLCNENYGYGKEQEYSAYKEHLNAGDNAYRLPVGNTYLYIYGNTIVHVNFKRGGIL
jgi:hypothetical protein